MGGPAGGGINTMQGGVTTGGFTQTGVNAIPPGIGRVVCTVRGASWAAGKDECGPAGASAGGMLQRPTCA